MSDRFFDLNKRMSVMTKEQRGKVPLLDLPSFCPYALSLIEWKKTWGKAGKSRGEKREIINVYQSLDKKPDTVSSPPFHYNYNQFLLSKWHESSLKNLVFKSK